MLPKKILAKICLPKKILKSKISNPKKFFDHPCHLKCGVLPPWGRHPCNTDTFYGPLSVCLNRV